MTDVSYDMIIELNTYFLKSHYETSTVVNLSGTPLKRIDRNIVLAAGRTAISLAECET